MKLTTLAEIVARLEGKKRPISIAQIKEVLACINEATYGDFYKWVRKQEVY